ncbi:alpha/beta hydrolase [Xylariaceae sp. FL1019]|nr:alpha/beta hydrolase [Xylariaceae sp. FL1019]
MPPPFEYSEIPTRAQQGIHAPHPTKEDMIEPMTKFGSVLPRAGDEDGATEIIKGITFTHHFVTAPGDYEHIRWHYVTCGRRDGLPIVFLHGVPDSWYQWHSQMAALSVDYFCISVDLKGYGQSDKTPGNYTHEGVSEQLYTLLMQIGLEKFYLVSHDRGTCQADFITANHPDVVIGYARGEQHLYHFNPILAPQEAMFRNAPWTGIMKDPKRFILWGYTWIAKLPIPDEVIARVIQEFSYDGITAAVPRYFNSSTFRQEWLTRRNRLLQAWKCPVMIMQGYESPTQPREFYENAREYIPNASDVRVRYMKGGHYWTHEDPEGTTDAIRDMLKMKSTS